MITNSYPSVAQAVMAWARPTKVYLVCKRQEDFKTVESYKMYTAKLMRQSAGQPLEMKTEGQRRWNNEIVYAETSLELKVDDVIIFDCEQGERFRVMEKINWAIYGYIEYKILSDYR
jgi:hypothetical protein